MENIDTLQSFLGWCTLVQFVLLSAATLIMVVFQKPIMRLHGGLFGLGDDDLKRAYFQYLAQFKLLVLVFNFVPYLVLRFFL